MAVQRVFDIVSEETRTTVEDPVAKVLRLGTVVGLANHTLLLTRDGREVPIDDCGAPIIDDAGEISGAVLVFRDISDRRAMDDALREAQAQIALVARLSRLGELAASIAHEVNQPLTAILSNAETCIRYLDEARAAADRMARNGARAGEIVQSIRRLAEPSAPALGPVAIDSVVTEVVEILRAEIRRCECAVELALGKPPPVAGDRVQLQQVVLNLVTNALEAMAGGPERRLSISTATEDGSVTVVIADTGPGLDPEIADKVFQPLATTKHAGMGLGLSICRSIVEAHGGRIEARPTDWGAAFAFTLPVHVA